MTTQIRVGDVVEINHNSGNAFYPHNKGKRGVVTNVNANGVRVDVQLEDGARDYGRLDGVSLVSKAPTLEVGGKAKIVAPGGGLFYSGNFGKIGTITRIREDVVHMEFENGQTDYGYKRDLTPVGPQVVKDAQGFIANTTGKMPFPCGTILDVKYEDGSIMRDVAIGIAEYTEGSTIEEGTETAGGRRYAYDWSLGTQRGTIVAYRLKADRPVVVPTAGVGSRIEMADMLDGMRVKLLSHGNGMHKHWGFEIGGVYTCRDRGVVDSGGSYASRNWAGWEWELVAEVPAPTFDEQLAALKAELEGVKAEKAAAEEEVKAAQAKVDEAEGKRVALVDRLAAHGMQFIGEVVAKPQTALEAHEAGTLKEGDVLMCVTSCDLHEHTPGRTYKVTDRDQGDRSEWKLESNDDYGWWVQNEELEGFTVVV